MRAYNYIYCETGSIRLSLIEYYKHGKEGCRIAAHVQATSLKSNKHIFQSTAQLNVQGQVKQDTENSAASQGQQFPN